MKTLIVFIFIMFTCVLSTSAAIMENSCTDNLPITSEHMVGKWQMIRGNGRYVMLFKDDNTFVGDIYKNGKSFIHTEGTWTVKNNTLHWHHLKSNKKRMEGIRDEDRIIELKCNSLLLINKSNVHIIYTRLKTHNKSSNQIGADTAPPG